MNRKKSRLSRCKREKKDRNIIVGIVAIIILGLSISYFNDKYIYNDTIANNIFIEDTDVSNLTTEEAKEVILQNYYPQDIVLEYEEKSYSITPDEIDLEYNVSEVVEQAYNYTKEESYFENVKRYLNLISNSKKIELSVSYDETKLSEAIQEISDEINTETVDAKVYISDTGNISNSSATIGKELDLPNTKEAIYEVIESKESENIQLKVDIKEPRVSTEDAKSVDKLLGEYSTTFSTAAANANRNHNIQLSASRTSDILLMPGEEFSYNDLTLQRTKSNGYKDAPVIINGELEEGIGGGVCQTSSTLFNAAMYAGLDITYRSSHSLKSSYTPIGRDAMVNEIGTDFRFKNPYSHPIYVKTVVSNGRVTSRIYGNASDKQNISIRVDEYTSNGLDAAKTYIEYRDNNGKILSTKYVANSVYRD